MSNQYQQNNNQILRTNTVNNPNAQITYKKWLSKVQNQNNIIQNNIISNPFNVYQFQNNNFDNQQNIIQQQSNIQNYNEGKNQQNNIEIFEQKIISQNIEGIEQNYAQNMFKNNIHIGQLNLANSEQIFNLNNQGMKKILYLQIMKIKI